MAKKNLKPLFQWKASLKGKRVKIMGLDLSLRHTGIAIINGNSELLHFESIVLKEQTVKKDRFFRMVFIGDDDKILGSKNITTENNKIHQMKRLESIVDRVLLLVQKFKVTHIAIEGYAMGGKGKVFDIAELGGVIKLMLMKMGFEYDKNNLYIIPPTSLKGYITGKGTASKEEMQASILLKYGMAFEDDNEADAFALSQILLDLGDEVKIFSQENGLDIYRMQREQEKEKNSQA